MKKFSLLSLMLCALTIVSACEGGGKQQTADPDGQIKDETTTQPVVGEPKGGVAIYGASSDPMQFWDPSDSYSNEIIAMNNMYETLLRYNPQNQTFKKVLAKDYKVSPDGLTWTFYLRDNVKFHTGAKLTADSVKKSIERTIQRGKGASNIWDSVKGIKVIDEYTVEFSMRYAAPLDNIVSSGYAAFIFDTEALAKNGDAWINEAHDVGSGPYKVKKSTKDSELILDYFPEYWGGWKENQFQLVDFKTILEANTRQQMIENGKMDFTFTIPIESLKAMKKNPGIVINETESFQQLVMQLNTKKGPLQNPKVRQALAYAIPYDQIIKDVMSGTATQSFGNIPKGLWGYDASLKQYKQDIDKAKSLLQEAGVTGGKLSLTYASGNEFQRRIAELLKAVWAKIGFDLEIKAMLWDAQWDLAKAKDPNQRQDVTLIYWYPDYGDPYTFMKNLYESEKDIAFNLAYYSNPEYDKLVEEAKQISGVERAKSIALYKKAQEILIEEVPGISLYDEKYVRVLRDNFKGYVDNPAYPDVVFFYDTYR